MEQGPGTPTWYCWNKDTECEDLKLTFFQILFHFFYEFHNSISVLQLTMKTVLKTDLLRPSHGLFMDILVTRVIDSVLLAY